MDHFDHLMDSNIFPIFQKVYTKSKKMKVLAPKILVFKKSSSVLPTKPVRKAKALDSHKERMEKARKLSKTT